MREVTGYFDGTSVQLLEPAPKTKQTVIVTFMDDANTMIRCIIGDNVLLAYHQLHGIVIYSYDRKLMNAIGRIDLNQSE